MQTETNHTIELRDNPKITLALRASAAGVLLSLDMRGVSQTTKLTAEDAMRIGKLFEDAAQRSLTAQGKAPWMQMPFGIIAPSRPANYNPLDDIARALGVPPDQIKKAMRSQFKDLAKDADEPWRKSLEPDPDEDEGEGKKHGR